MDKYEQLSGRLIEVMEGNTEYRTDELRISLLNTYDDWIQTPIRRTIHGHEGGWSLVEWSDRFIRALKRFERQGLVKTRRIGRRHYVKMV